MNHFALSQLAIKKGHSPPRLEIKKLNQYKAAECELLAKNAVKILQNKNREILERKLDEVEKEEEEADAK
jgi:hypothetical protein